MLLSQDPDNKITVAAKHMPGDYDIEYTSPWAGANYLPYVTHLFNMRTLSLTQTYLGWDRKITRLDNGKKRHGHTFKNWLKIAPRPGFIFRVTSPGSIIVHSGLIHLYRHRMLQSQERPRLDNRQMVCRANQAESVVQQSRS